MQKSVSAVIAGLSALVVILAALVAYSFANPSARTGASCPTMADSMDMASSGSIEMSPVIQNATTADYKFMLVLGPQEEMFELCQVTNSTMDGEVMVGGEMMSMDMESMSVPQYHLEVHIFDINTGAVVVVPLNAITITIKNSSGMSMNVPISEMYGLSEGATDMHYGNNVQLTQGSYAVTVAVAGEAASFNITVPKS